MKTYLKQLRHYVLTAFLNIIEILVTKEKINLEKYLIPQNCEKNQKKKGSDKSQTKNFKK